MRSIAIEGSTHWILDS